MKSRFKFNILFVLAIMTFFFNQVFSGLYVGGDMFFTTRFVYEASNEVNPTNYNTFVGKSTYLFVGLYPYMKEKSINGLAEIYVNTADFVSLITRANSNYNLIYFGGANIKGTSAGGEVEATGFALSPAFTLSDPMMTGTRYSFGLYTLPITRMTRFVETNIYPLIFDESMLKGLRGFDYELGGENAVGISAKVSMIDKMLNLETYALWNVLDFYSAGFLFKLNPFNIADIITIEAGLTADFLKYRRAQDFDSINKYLYYDLMRRMPSQSSVVGYITKTTNINIINGTNTNRIQTNIISKINNMSEDSLIEYGGYINFGIMNLLNLFSEIKLSTLKGLVSDPDLQNSLNGYSIYSGVYTKALEGSIFELDFGMLNEVTNETTGFSGNRNGLEVKAKAYGMYQLDEDETILFGFLLEGTYGNFYDNINYLTTYENLTLPKSGTNNNVKMDTFSGFEVKASLWSRIFYMFYLREILRFAMPTFSNVDISYSPVTLESRTYIDIDLEDLTPGLWTTFGLRYINNDISTTSTNTNVIKGNASYILPYFELKYIFGEDSFLRLTFGVGELTSLLGNAYNLGFDNIRRDSMFGLTPSGNLYNNVDYNLQNNYTISLEFGVRL